MISQLDVEPETQLVVFRESQSGTIRQNCGKTAIFDGTQVYERLISAKLLTLFWSIASDR